MKIAQPELLCFNIQDAFEGEKVIVTSTRFPRFLN